MATEFLSSDPFVEQHVLPQQIAVDFLHANDYHQGIAAIALGTAVEKGTSPIANVAFGAEAASFDLIPAPAIVPYMTRLDTHLAKVGIGYYSELYGTPEEAENAVQRHQALGNKVIVMLPCDESVVATLVPEADIDGLTEEGKLRSYPATSLAVLDYADQAMPGGLASVDPERITFVGRGRLVNEGAIRRLESEYGVTPGRIIDRNNAAEEIPRLHHTSDVVISAVGVPGLLKTANILRQPHDTKTPMTVIDAGVAAIRDEDGSPHRVVYGDVHLEAYFYDGDQRPRISPAPVRFGEKRVNFGYGVGALTVAWLANNAIAAIERDAGQQASSIVSFDQQSAADRNVQQSGAR